MSDLPIEAERARIVRALRRKRERLIKEYNASDGLHRGNPFLEQADAFRQAIDVVGGVEADLAATSVPITHRQAAPPPKSPPGFPELYCRLDENAWDSAQRWNVQLREFKIAWDEWAGGLR